MKRGKAILILGLVFAAGFIGGVVTTRVVVRRVIAAAIQRPELVRDRIEHELVRKLRLDNAQHAKLYEALVKAQGQLKTLRQEFQPRFTDIVAELRDDVRPVLNPEQVKRLEELQRQNPSWLKP
jgi:hypothetical protein